MSSAVREDQDADLFREAMASFPSGVTVVTTTDDDGKWWGFTASSFCSVSMAPPLVLTCVNKSAQCWPVFTTARRWVIHVLHAGQVPLAVRFATRGVDKFAGAGFAADANGLPVLAEASVALDCVVHARPDGGDHTILIGRVERTRVWPQAPSIYYRRAFHEFD
ncbi:flavin reductase family protein [Amycolatopsis sp. FDAARGOS 1241]|uniref:flavin reductase family protein n=1 Tax=Amycolatopsis sp. FDAARGOS 1241 TaxID=2778070 RepID=UPI001951C2C4|nr:flavin reductase family protein [Amycolatopsis sp. FDAARGOS 1241]QRP50414.1 flavin reductase family protein [Amycolatopsis sp. FDAARGOS 1241]